MGSASLIYKFKLNFQKEKKINPCLDHFESFSVGNTAICWTVSVVESHVGSLTG